MSRTRWERALWRAELPASAKLVGLAVAACSADGDEASPCVADLQAMTGWTRAYTLRALRRLHDSGWLEAVPDPGRVTVRRLVLPEAT